MFIFWILRFKKNIFQALLLETKKKAKSEGIELRGRLFSKEHIPVNRIKNGEKENIQKVMSLESKINSQIETNKECSGETCKFTGPCVMTITVLSTVMDLLPNLIC